MPSWPCSGWSASTASPADAAEHGRSGPGRRPRPSLAAVPPDARPPLSRARIVTAAVAFVDAHGLEALSMRKLGAELDVEAMSLYNHVANKDDLLDAVLEQALVEVPLPPPGPDWRSRLRALAEGFRAVGLRHPGVLPLFGARPVRSLAGFAPIECAFDILRSAGLSADEALDAVIAAASFVFGFVMVEEGGFRQVAEGRSADLGALDVAEHPRLLELAHAIARRDSDRQFEVGLQVVLDGIAARLGAAPA